MSEVIINVTKRTPRDSLGKRLFPKELLDITIKSLDGELEGDFVRSNRDSFSTRGFVK